MHETVARAQLPKKHRKRSEHSEMPRSSWQAGLQLEVAKRIVKAARREDLGCRSYRRAR